MTAALRRMVAIWAVLLAAVVCLCFLPVSRLTAVLMLLWIAAGTMLLLWALRRRADHAETIHFSGLPDVTYRQPVVLCCGDQPQPWPGDCTVLTVTQGCWILVEEGQDIQQVGRQLLAQRPEWGRQLSVMITVCPQQHADTESLTNRLLALRWQIAQLRREIRQEIPLILHAQTGSEIVAEPLFEAALPDDPINVWLRASAPSPVASWLTQGGSKALHQQLLMNSLMSWFYQHVPTVFMDNNPDIPQITPNAMVWGLCAPLANARPDSLWLSWLQQHTALKQVAGWQPDAGRSFESLLLPDFVLPLLPEGRGITPRQRAWRHALSLFTVAAIAALCSSGWNNHQLLQRLAFDIGYYHRIPMTSYAPKAEAVKVLQQDASQLDNWARNGVPLRLGLGLYQGARLHMPVLDAIRSYVPPPPTPPKVKPVPKIVRLDSLSLFDSGKSVLKTGSTKVLVNALVGIKAKPGWLIVVAGHTDNTGNQQLNQKLSQQRAQAVRDWMRDTGDVPESCFAVQGYGQGRPVASNDTPEGRALNRRVEISLVPQADACQVPGMEEKSPEPGDARS